MGNSLRCCLACVLPCGAFDVVRIVHLSGQVEEHSRHISAGEVLAANPGHILRKPCGSQGGSAVRRCILIVSPEFELRRGHIYFLVPAASIATLHDHHKKKIHTRRSKVTNQNHHHHHHQQQQQQHESVKDRQNMSQESPAGKKLSHHRRRRTGRVGVWRPHLESICEGF